MSGSDKDFELGSPAAAELWRKFQAGRGPGNDPAGEAPDPMLIAAYMDGSVDPEVRDRVEAWLAGSPDALSLVLAARAAQAATPPAAPPELLARARGLVRPAAVEAGRERTLAGWFAGLARPSVWAASAAVMLFAAVVSFELGREATVNLTAAQSLTVAMAEDDVLDFDPSAGDLL
jgi:anti-sigma factor RsiW